MAHLHHELDREMSVTAERDRCARVICGGAGFYLNLRRRG